MSIEPVKHEPLHANPRERWIGVYIGILAVLLAICSMGGGNATNDAIAKNIEASNTWGFFQAKNLRRQGLKIQADDLELRLTAEAGLSDAARKAITDRIADYRAQEKKLTSDPEKQEGLDELWARGKKLESERDLALKRGPYFDYGSAMLQIAIVLASVAIISGASLVLAASGVLGLLGAALTLGGFTLIFPFPF